ncbi:MAG TPA: 3-dehydroquinate synthase [Desulfuromonadales bacterium]|nr:3-dehydroquinate synthase [Desulfuromonadales bacterium]
MKQLLVGLDDRSYPIGIGAGNLEQIAEPLERVGFSRKTAIITNPLVGGHYGQRLVDALRRSGRDVSVLQLPDGEAYKNQETLQAIYDALIEQKFDRHCGLIALGGGVIGDLTGFAAATFLRGIPFVQVPTSLLAQVDSSVGGKTGINHPRGKNLIGAFYQPKYVHIDVTVLETLAEREFASGLAEVIKYGMIADADFFTWLEDHVEPLLRRDPQVLMRAVMISCQIKANVVENDEKETGLRAILNFGHTFGHAIETLAGYGVIKHGEAVAIGMLVAAAIARRKGLCENADVDRLRKLLLRCQLPVRIPDFQPEEYLEIMKRDKKVKEGRFRFVLNHGIGEADLYVVDDLGSLLPRVLEDIA